MSPRYVLSLITHLPPDGAFYASRMGGVQYRGWDASRYALVAMVNEQRANNHLLMLINRDPKRSKPKAPTPFPTPDDDRPKAHKPGSFAAMVVAAKAAARRKKELR